MILRRGRGVECRTGGGGGARSRGWLLAMARQRALRFPGVFRVSYDGVIHVVFALDIAISSVSPRFSTREAINCGSSYRDGTVSCRRI